MQKKWNARAIVFAGLLIALEIIMTRFMQIPLPYFEVIKERISLGFLPVAVAGMLYGPVGGGIIAAAADIIRAVLFPVGGAINPLFTVTACLRGVIFGLFLHRSVRPLGIIGACLIIFTCVNVFLNSLFISLSYGGTLVSRIVTKLPFAAVNLVIQTVVLLLLLPQLERSFRKHV